MKRLWPAALVLPLAVLAEDGKKQKDFTKLETVAGTVVCLGCELETQGADAQCTLHARHAQGLKDAEGNLWTFLDNKRGHAMATNAKLRGKEIRVRAWKYEKARYLELWQYEVKDKDSWTLWSWCDN